MGTVMGWMGAEVEESRAVFDVLCVLSNTGRKPELKMRDKVLKFREQSTRPA